MKRNIQIRNVFLLTCLFMGWSQHVFSQTWQQVQTSGGAFNGGAAKNGFVVGAASNGGDRIVYSSAGSAWQGTNSPNYGWRSSVVDGSTAYVTIDGIGTPYSVVKTTDGGATWTPVQNNTGKAVHFVDANNGYVIGTTSYKFNGTNWQTISSPLQASGIENIYFSSSTTGYAVGNNKDVNGFLAPTLDTTSNSGNSWKNIVLPTNLFASITGAIGGRFLDIVVSPTNIIYACGVVLTNNGYKVLLAKSSDASGSWILMNPTSQYDGFLYGITIQGTTVYAVGSNGLILKAEIGVDNFSVENGGYSNALYDIAFDTDGIGYAFGENGIILKKGGNNPPPNSPCTDCNELRIKDTFIPREGSLWNARRTTFDFENELGRGINSYKLEILDVSGNLIAPTAQQPNPINVPVTQYQLRVSYQLQTSLEYDTKYRIKVTAQGILGNAIGCMSVFFTTMTQVATESAGSGYDDVGTPFGAAQNVVVFNNRRSDDIYGIYTPYPISFSSPEGSSIGNYGFQCKEYITRYYLQRYRLLLPSSNNEENANRKIYDDPLAGLKTFQNGQTGQKPRVGDILVFSSSGAISYDHSAIVSKIEGNNLFITHQNYGTASISDYINKPISLSLSNGKYTVGSYLGNNNNNGACIGWVRAEPTLLQPSNDPTFSDALALPYTTPSFELFQHPNISKYEIIIEKYNPIYNCYQNIDINGQPTIPFDNNTAQDVNRVFLQSGMRYKVRVKLTYNGDFKVSGDAIYFQIANNAIPNPIQDALIEVGLNSTITLKTTGSLLPGVKIDYKKQGQSSWSLIDHTNINGDALLEFSSESPVLEGDSLRFSTGSYQTIVYAISAEDISQKRIRVPMYFDTSQNTDRISRPFLKFLERDFTTNSQATLLVKANNISSFVIMNGYDVQTYSPSDSLVTIPLQEGCNLISVKFKNGNDSLELLDYINYIPLASLAEKTFIFKLTNPTGSRLKLLIDGKPILETDALSSSITLAKGVRQMSIVGYGFQEIEREIHPENPYYIFNPVSVSHYLDTTFLALQNHAHFLGAGVSTISNTATLTTIKKEDATNLGFGLVPISDLFHKQSSGDTQMLIDIDVNYKIGRSNALLVYNTGLGYQKADLDTLSHVIFDSLVQKLSFTITADSIDFLVTKRQAPINLNSILTLKAGDSLKIHKNQFFSKPDSLISYSVNLLDVTSNSFIQTEIIGDSVKILAGCFKGTTNFSVIGSYDGLQSVNNLVVQVLPHADLTRQVNVERDTVCKGQTNRISVLTELGKIYTIFYSDSTQVGVPKLGTGNQMEFNIGELNTVGLNEFIVTVANQTCIDTLTARPSIFVNELPTPPVVSDQVICKGELVASFSLTGTNYNYTEWYGNNLGSILLGTGNSFTPPANLFDSVGTHDFYVAQFDSITGCRSDLKRVSLIVNPLPTFSLIEMIESGDYVVAVDGTIEVCRPAQIVINAAEQLDPLHHSFYWVNQSTTNNQITVSNTSEIILLTTLDSSGCQYSDTLRFAFFNKPENNFISSETTGSCSGQLPNKITGSVPREGKNGSYFYQWQHKNASTNNEWADITNETNRDLIFTDFTQTTNFRRLVTSICDTLSNEIKIDYIQKPTISSYIGRQEVTENTTIKTCPLPQESLLDVGDTLFVRTDIGEISILINGVLHSRGQNYIVLRDNMNIQAVATNTVNNVSCQDTSFLIRVQKQPVINYFLTANKTEICQNESATLSLDILYPLLESNYQIKWFKDGLPYVGNEYSLTVSQSGEYKAVISNDICQLETHTITIESLPTPSVLFNIFKNGQQLQANQNDVLHFCEGDRVSFEIAEPTANSNYDWRINGRSFSSENQIHISTNSSIQLFGSNGICNSSSEILQIAFDSNIPPLLTGVRAISCKDNAAFVIRGNITGVFSISSRDTSFIVNGNSLMIDPQKLPANTYSVSFNYLSNNCNHISAMTEFSILKNLVVPTIIEENEIFTIDSVVTSQIYMFEFSLDGINWTEIAQQTSILPTRTGYYRVKTLIENCFAYSNKVLYTHITTGIEKMSRESAILYPNPSSLDYFTLELSTDWIIASTHIKITDPLGRVVVTKPVRNYKTFISYKLQPNIYIVEIQNEKQTLTLKLVIQ